MTIVIIYMKDWRILAKDLLSPSDRLLVAYHIDKGLFASRWTVCQPGLLAADQLAKLYVNGSLPFGSKPLVFKRLASIPAGCKFEPNPPSPPRSPTYIAPKTGAQKNEIPKPQSRTPFDQPR